MWEPRRRATGARIHLPFPVVYSSLNSPGTKWQPGDLFTMRQQSRPSQVVEKNGFIFQNRNLISISGETSDREYESLIAPGGA